MIALTEPVEKLRWSRRFAAAETLGQDLGFIGLYVGPRHGPDCRTHGQKEDYVLRRLLAAWRLSGELAFPLEVRAAAESASPDFLLLSESKSAVGLEVTEAGEEQYQAWLTRSEGRGSAHDEIELSTSRTVDTLVHAIRKKVDKFEQRYRHIPQCDLAVYDNTHSGGFLDKRDLVKELRSKNELAGRFRQVHVVFGEHVVLDLFGSAVDVDVSRAYEVDYLRWTEDQVEKLRQRKTEGLDLADIAEELGDLGASLRRSLASHLRNLLLHLLKHQFQSKRRSRSWIASIGSAREEIVDLLFENPSLRSEFRAVAAEQYVRARRLASKQTGLPTSAFPEHCPYSPEQVLDDDFLP